LINKYLKEPLLHFLVLGGLIFYIYSSLNNGFEDEEKIIIIPQTKINQLTTIWKKKFLREPSQKEIQKLIDKAIYSQIMSKEALNLGLQQDDPVIERRLVQKMEFLSENFIPKVEPTEEELNVFIEANADEFLEPTQISFHFKNAVMGQKEYNNLSQYGVSRLLGREFAKRVFALEVGVWHRDILSPYGNHTLFVDFKKDAQLPQLQEIKSRVKEAYIAKKEIELQQNFYERLKSEYTIKVGK